MTPPGGPKTGGRPCLQRHDPLPLHLSASVVCSVLSLCLTGLPARTHMYMSSQAHTLAPCAQLGLASAPQEGPGPWEDTASPAGAQQSLRPSAAAAAAAAGTLQTFRVSVSCRRTVGLPKPSSQEVNVDTTQLGLVPGLIFLLCFDDIRILPACEKRGHKAHSLQLELSGVEDVLLPVFPATGRADQCLLWGSPHPAPSPLGSSPSWPSSGALPWADRSREGLQGLPCFPGGLVLARRSCLYLLHSDMCLLK